jgi:hypothetical protein
VPRRSRCGASRGLGLEEADPELLTDVLVVDGVERAVCAQLGERPIDAVGERAVQLEHEAHLVNLLLGREGADDGAFRVGRVPVLKLSVADVEGGAQVDDEAVDLAVLERDLGRRVVGWMTFSISSRLVVLDAAPRR